VCGARFAGGKKPSGGFPGGKAPNGDCVGSPKCIEVCVCGVGNEDNPPNVDDPNEGCGRGGGTPSTE